MIDPIKVPPVGSDEKSARYILQSSHIRRSDATVKADAFVPHPYQDLSVNRHLSATDVELSESGGRIAMTIGKTLHGRADIRCSLVPQIGIPGSHSARVPRQPTASDKTGRSRATTRSHAQPKQSQNVSQDDRSEMR